MRARFTKLYGKCHLWPATFAAILRPGILDFSRHDHAHVQRMHAWKNSRALSWSPSFLQIVIWLNTQASQSIRFEKRKKTWEEYKMEILTKLRKLENEILKLKGEEREKVMEIYRGLLLRLKDDPIYLVRYE